MTLVQEVAKAITQQRAVHEPEEIARLAIRAGAKELHAHGEEVQPTVATNHPYSRAAVWLQIQEGSVSS